MISTSPVKQRLFNSGTILFGKRGFAGVSVREICNHADTSQNMIHHFFGSKQGLLDAIIDGFSKNIFLKPSKLLDSLPRSTEDFISRIELVFEITLDACINSRKTFLVVLKEKPNSRIFVDYANLFIDFINRCKRRGFVRNKIDSVMIAGYILDRFYNQVQFAPWIKDISGVDLVGDGEYRYRWCKTNLDIIIHGVLPR